MMTVLSLLLLSIIPHDDVLRDSADLVEINHFYDEHGRLVFDQVIWYDWAPPYTGPLTDDVQTRFVDETEDIRADDWRFQLRAWRLVKNPNIMPVRDWQRGGYSSFWEDGNQGMRLVNAKSIRETWTQEDPELYERRFLPKEKRRGLKEPNVRPKTDGDAAGSPVQ
jgi:hypothetical protein